MQIEYAILADAAKVRDGLLYVIAGGITNINLAALPSAVNVSLALKFKGTRAEVERQHRLEVRVVDEDGRPSPDIQPIDVQFTPVSNADANGVDAEILFVAELHNALIRRPGTYMIDVLLDGRSYKRLPLTITSAGQQAA